MMQHEHGTNDVPEMNEPTVDVDTNETYTQYEEIGTVTPIDDAVPTAPENTPEQVTLTPEQVEIYKIRLAEETYNEILKLKEVFKNTFDIDDTEALAATTDEHSKRVNAEKDLKRVEIQYLLLIDKINEALMEALDNDGIDDINLQGKLNFWWVMNNHKNIITLVSKIASIVKAFKVNKD